MAEARSAVAFLTGFAIYRRLYGSTVAVDIMRNHVFEQLNELPAAILPGRLRVGCLLFPYIYRRALAVEKSRQ
jgi:hypothetical protein